jgi:hypothetical protein
LDPLLALVVALALVVDAGVDELEELLLEHAVRAARPMTASAAAPLFAVIR